MPPKKVTKSRVEKLRNHFTLSEAGFWSLIRSNLRNASRWWKPIAEAKKRVKRAKKNGGRQKFEYQCNHCKNWFPDKNVNVDHIIPAGSLTSANDLPGFLERLFCEVDGLQVLCQCCHDIKTKQEKLKK